MNKKNIFQFLTISLLLAAIVIGGTFFTSSQEPSVQNSSVNSQQTSPVTAEKATKGTLLFFLNPGGRPCQMQARIIHKSKAEIEKYVQIKYISTSDSSSRSMFYQFGIRGLPSMIILNSDQSIAHRLPPGIQPVAQILRTLKQMK